MIKNRPKNFVGWNWHFKNRYTDKGKICSKTNNTNKYCQPSQKKHIALFRFLKTVFHHSLFLHTKKLTWGRGAFHLKLGGGRRRLRLLGRMTKLLFLCPFLSNVFIAKIGGFSSGFGFFFFHSYQTLHKQIQQMRTHITNQNKT